MLVNLDKLEKRHLQVKIVIFGVSADLVRRAGPFQSTKLHKDVYTTKEPLTEGLLYVAFA